MTMSNSVKLVITIVIHSVWSWSHVLCLFFSLLIHLLIVLIPYLYMKFIHVNLLFSFLVIYSVYTHYTCRLDLLWASVWHVYTHIYRCGCSLHVDSTHSCQICNSSKLIKVQKVALTIQNWSCWWKTEVKAMMFPMAAIKTLIVMLLSSSCLCHAQGESPVDLDLELAEGF